MKEWFSASELAGLPGLPGTQRRVTEKSKRESWKSRKRKGRGGGREYHLSSLPAETQAHLLLHHSSSADITPAAWDWFKADYLRPDAPAAKACYNRLLRVAKEHGWTVPDIRTMERRIKKEIPRAVLVLARQGQDALKRLYPAHERDRSVFHALEAVNADGHKFDVFVQWPDGEIGRPMMCAWQDIYSGKLLAWRIDKTNIGTRP